jgi:hypothetical protein
MLRESRGEEEIVTSPIYRGEFSSLTTEQMIEVDRAVFRRHAVSWLVNCGSGPLDHEGMYPSMMAHRLHLIASLIAPPSPDDDTLVFRVRSLCSCTFLSVLFDAPLGAVLKRT